MQAQSKEIVPAWFIDAYTRRASESELLRLVEKACQKQLEQENRLLGSVPDHQTVDKNWVRNVYMLYLAALRK